VVGCELIDTPLLDGLGQEERDCLAALFTRQEYPAGVAVIRQGEECASFFVVESGSLLAHSEQRGVLARLGPGECLGEIGMLTGQPASATITAATDLILQAAPQAEVRALLERTPLLARNLCRLLGRRLATASQQIEHSRLVLLVSATKEAGIGLVLNLASSVAYHLQQDVAVIDLSPGPNGSGIRPGPTFEHPWERLTVVRAEAMAPDELVSLAESMARQCRYVLAWAPETTRARLEPLLGSADRLIRIVSHEECRRNDAVSVKEQRDLPAELLVLGTPEPRSLAQAEAIERETGLKVCALLPDLPQALKPTDAAPDWVLRHRDTLFSRATARLARRLGGKSVGVALGGGSGRGYAHIGVLQALERLGIRPDVVAGTSIGACLGGLYAYGVPFHEMELMLRRLGQLVRGWSLPIYSLMAGSGLDRALRHSVPAHLQMEDFPLPCAFVATDLMSGEEIVLRRGCAWQSARASASIPGVFPPVEMHGRLLVDGGVVTPVPCRVARDLGADIVLGVSLETIGPREAPESSVQRGSGGARGPTWLAALIRALDLQLGSLNKVCVYEADVPLRTFTPALSLMNFRGGPEFLEAGERAVEAATDRLRALLPWVM
jgi:NTE family protein